jgi:hypothetical protein
MPNDDRAKIIYSRTPESAAMLANVKRAMAITATLNRLTFNDANEIRAMFSELIGKRRRELFTDPSVLYCRWRRNPRRSARLHQSELHFL